jgi:hypothetical protein
VVEAKLCTKNMNALATAGLWVVVPVIMMMMSAGATGSVRGESSARCCAWSLEEAGSRDVASHQNKRDHQPLAVAH